MQFIEIEYNIQFGKRRGGGTGKYFIADYSEYLGTKINNLDKISFVQTSNTATFCSSNLSYPKINEEIRRKIKDLQREEENIKKMVYIFC